MKRVATYNVNKIFNLLGLSHVSKHNDNAFICQRIWTLLTGGFTGWEFTGWEFERVKKTGEFTWEEFSVHPKIY